MKPRIQKTRQLASRAIFDRLGYHHHAAILDVFPDPDHEGAILLHVNSGGNAQACRVALLRHGFRVEDTGYNPFGSGSYGVQVRVWQP